MLSKKENRWKKPLMIAFLVMIVLGFSVPLFNLGGNTDQSAQTVPPRLCQNDAECYLMCDSKPVEILCQQNLCVQNSCTEFNPYLYKLESTEIALSVTINDAQVSLQNRNAQDLFVRFDAGVAVLHAQGLSLAAILEKAGIIMQDQCMVVAGTRYCPEKEKKLNILVNGENTYLYGQYVPKQNDEIKIIYS